MISLSVLAGREDLRAVVVRGVQQLVGADVERPAADSAQIAAPPVRDPIVRLHPDVSCTLTVKVQGGDD